MIIGKVQNQNTYSYKDVLDTANKLLKAEIAKAYKDLTGKDKMPETLTRRLAKDKIEHVLAMDATLKSLRGQS